MAKKKSAPGRAPKVPVCSPVSLPSAQSVQAAQRAIAINPINAPDREGIGSVLRLLGGRVLERLRGRAATGPGGYEMAPMPTEVVEDDDVMDPQFLSVLTTKYWGAKGVELSVGFMEQTPDDLANKILEHMNAWGTVAGANVQFKRTRTSPQVRISREGSGYWSYIGTDIQQIPAGQPTMNLQAFTMRTIEAEFVRVVRHETGHTLGFPHEHTREDIVSQLDPAKTVAYFGRTQGWSPQQVRQQILTPVPESALLDPTVADELSIMAYQFPALCTKDGEPIPGGYDINDTDAAYARKIYPRQTGNGGGGGGDGGKPITQQKTVVIRGNDLTVKVIDG